MHSFGKLQHSAFQNYVQFVCATIGSKVIRIQSNPTTSSPVLSLVKVVLRALKDFDTSNNRVFFYEALENYQKN
jgi:hypothetical protein